jgi:Ca-activated chloride channel family protein
MRDARWATGTNVHHLLNHLRLRMRPALSFRRSIRAVSTVLTIATAITVAVVAAPAQRLSSDDGPTFRGHIDLVNIGATVSGKKRQFVTDLSANDFAITEDGKPQQIVAFASGAEPGPPLHVGVLLDVSGSQELDLPFTQTAVIKFLGAVPDAVDMTFIDFGSTVRSARYTQEDFPRLVDRVRRLRTDGYTALYDAIAMYLDEAAEQDGRKVMVLYTDGGDTASRLSLNKLMKWLKASDVTLYAIGALENQPQSVQFMQGALLSEMAEATGGTAFFTERVKDLDKIYEQVLGEVRAQYTLGYVSTNDNTDGKWRKVKIQITRQDAKGLKVRARKGYFGPSPTPSKP